MQKILVTGANGFLGQNLLNSIAGDKKFKIYGLVKYKKNFKKIKNIKYIQGDVTNFKNLKKGIKINFDIIINFAGNIDHKIKVRSMACMLNLADVFKLIIYRFNNRSFAQ